MAGNGTKGPTGPVESGTGLTHLINAFGWSLAGLRAAFRHESAFRQEVALFALLAPAAFYLGEGRVEVALLLGSLFIVLITELLNSAVEATVDRISDQRHELAGRAKDIGSAAVFLSIALAVATWAILLLP